MSNLNLDLDALNPSSVTVTINGKSIECKPLTIKNYIQVIRLQEMFADIQSFDEIMPTLIKTMSPFVPAMLEEDFDLTLVQARELILFAIKISIPQVEDKGEDVYTDPKKKPVSAEELPIS